MGKASRWMINLLLGKREEKDKKKDAISFHEEAPTATPSYKRRWSFGKSSRKQTSIHKSSRSFDGTPFAAHSSWLPEFRYQPRKSEAALSLVTRDQAVKPAATATHAHAEDRIIEDAAAIRIQAAFRSFLARKALYALKGLVKLQALARGHLVRKQTTATLRQMHALISIQVRARFQRIQMVEESVLAIKSKSARYRNSCISRGSGPRETHKEDIDVNLYETQRVLKNKHRYLNYSQIDRTEKETTKHDSGDLPIFNRQHEHRGSTAQRSPLIYSTTSDITPRRASFNLLQPDYEPNYMANTESSRAKVRSLSEPKQRPKWSIKPKGKQTTSTEDVQQDVHTQWFTSHTERMAFQNQDPWFVKLYQSTRSKVGDQDARSIASSSCSDYSKILVTYEPHLKLY